jgi:raffinose/stachyose/melibiose transport system permease protein
VRSRALDALRATFLTLLAIAFVGVPVWAVLVNSAKSLAEVSPLTLAPPHHWNIGSNYGAAIHRGDLWHGLLNSVLVTVPTILLVLVTSAMAAWVFARSRSRVVRGVYYVSIIGVLVPPAVITEIKVLTWLGLEGQHAGLVGVYSAMTMSLGILLITGFVKTLPIELEEAARLDGCSRFATFLRIVLPLLSPILTTCGIFVAILTWNEFFYAFFVLEAQSKLTLPLNLFQFASATLYVNNWNLIFAFVVLSSLPMIVAYALAQRRVVAGITGGAVK